MILLLLLNLVSLHVSFRLQSVVNVRSTVITSKNLKHIKQSNHHQQLQLSQQRYRSKRQSQFFMRNEFIINEKDDDVLKRIAGDKIGLIRWIEESGGSFIPNIEVDKRHGWSLYSPQTIPRGEIVASIPKSICIFSNIPDNNTSPLLESTQNLMKSLSEKQWRARLAIAVLSERVRPNSQFRMYIRNLPFEFRGLPLFYSPKEFEMIQDLVMTTVTSARCRFLNEFVEQVLKPLPPSSPSSPFSGHACDLNAYGWAFAAACTRAVRNPDVLCSLGPALVPGLDMASHSFSPNTEIVSTPENYFLISTKVINEGDEVTINYGPYNNNDLLMDYGFTISQNPYEVSKLKCDGNLINTARVAMSQGTYSNENYFMLGKYKYDKYNFYSSSAASSLSSQSQSLLSPSSSKTTSAATTNNINSNNNKQSSSTTTTIIINNIDDMYRTGEIGRHSSAYDEKWLHAWQTQWLSVLQLLSTSSSISSSSNNKNSATASSNTASASTTATTTPAAVTLSAGNKLSSIDGKLWAFLRIIYSHSEEDITQHGYTPFLLQNAQSMLSLDNEIQVVKTLIGIVAVALHVYETDMHTDLELLWKDTIDISALSSSGTGSSTNVANTFINQQPQPRKSSGSGSSTVARDIITEVQKYLRNLLNEPSVTFDATSHQQLLQQHIQRIKVNVTAILDEYDNSYHRQQLQQQVSSITDHENNSDINTQSSSSSTTTATNNVNTNTTTTTATAANNNNNIQTYGGKKLSWNLQEILKYRIRKKNFLHDLLLELMNHFDRVTTTAAATSSAANNSNSRTTVKVSLLPSEDRGGRRAKIKDLLNEIRSRDGVQEDSVAAASKLSAKWLDTNLAL